MKVLNATPPPSPLEQAQAELAQDSWDFRRIPGARYCEHYSNDRLNFTPVPALFRSIVKHSFRFRLTNWGLMYCSSHLISLKRFLTFFHADFPQTERFQQLSVSDSDAYLVSLKATPMYAGKTRNENAIWRDLNALDMFLRYLQRIESPLAPTRPLDQMIWPSHGGNRRSIQTVQKIKDVPQFVLEQLDQHLEAIHPRYLPLLLVLRASGWRIADVVHLRYDTCLERVSTRVVSVRGYSENEDIRTHSADYQRSRITHPGAMGVEKEHLLC